MQKASWITRPGILAFILTLGILTACGGQPVAPAETPPVSVLHIVMDDNYPPYVFKDEEGNLRGILIDQWKLWEERAGVKAEITALPWGEALSAMKAGQYDVIDTIFQTAEREAIFDFTEAYAQIEVRIFFPNSISGIAAAEDLKGFHVAVKSGDANADYLLERGVTNLSYYDSYAAIIQAAAAKQETIFVIDQPPALYFLYKNGIQGWFKSSPPLYSGAFHRAVKKGDAATLKLVQDGFARLSPAEYQALNERWMGVGPDDRLQQWIPWLGFGGASAALVIILLFSFNYTLQRQVSKRTQELERALIHLRQSENRFQLAMQATSDGLWDWNLTSGEVYYSPGYLRMLGYKADEFDSTYAAWRERVHPDDVAEAERALAEHQAGRRTQYAVEFRLKAKDGSWRWIFARGKVVERDAQENATRMIGTHTDITARKEIDERLREREAQVRRLNAELEQRVQVRTSQLEAANKELEAFAYSVSHDLRAPLRAIEGFSFILLRDHAGQLDEKVRTLLERIQKANQNMSQLVDALLLLSRMTRAELNRREVNLSRLALGIAETLRQGDPERQVEFVIARDIQANGDPQLLGAALENLLGNAWKFTSKCAAARIEFGAAEQAGETVYFVKDNGVGFNMAYANKLFMAFQRLHKPSEYEGTGIGLATVQRIILRHEGRIWAEAEEGKGAAFYFTLKKSPAQSTQPPAA